MGGTRGTRVTVFIDDAVLGRFPTVCAKTGAPAEGMATVRRRVGGTTGLGVMWLLVLAGPLGWLALLFIATFRNGDDGEILTIQVPWTTEAQEYLDKHQSQARLWRAVWVGSLVAIVGLLFAQNFGMPRIAAEALIILLLITVAMALLRGLLESHAANRAQVGLSLDASRRWVTLQGVHPNFVAAIERTRRSQPNPQQ